MISFVLSPIISRLYSVSDFGHLAIFMTIAGFFIILATSRLELALILPKDDEDAHAIVKLSFMLSFFISLLSFFLTYFFKSQIDNYYKIDFSLSWIIILPFVVFFSSSFAILLNYNNRLKNYNKQAGANALLGISNPVSSIVIFLQSSFQYGLIQAILISNALTSFYLFPVLIKNNVLQTKSTVKKVFKEYYRFPFFTMPHAMLNFISNSLPVLILTPVFGEITIGLFTMALGKVFKPINMVGSSIYQVLSKKIVDDIHNSKPVVKQYTKLVFRMFLIGIVPFTILFIFAPNVFSFIWGAKWMISGEYLRSLLPWLFFVYLAGCVSFIPNLFKEQKGALIIETIHLILRFFALSYGAKTNDIKMALLLFSLSGVLMLSVTLVWYYFILRKEENKLL